MPDLTPEDPAGESPLTSEGLDRERADPSEDEAPPDPSQDEAPTGPSAAEAPPPARPGLSTFTIEGRAAPGLFVVGWLASIAGLALIFIGAFAPSALFLYFLGPTVLTIGLIAGCGDQAIERRARGAAYAGPSPYLVFATIVAATIAQASALTAGVTPCLSLAAM